MRISYNKLWHILIDKEIKKSQLSSMCHMSNSTLAKLSKNQPVKREVLVKISEVLGCEVEDIVEYKKNTGGDL
ncbi:MAG: helix-turn-helix transcriptional regulator [Lachnospiraceae bacterium]|nr:helix-turn-helix transcriptional regulator [Lachnospiraceae bacterium]